jgi:hypothetical protein
LRDDQRRHAVLDAARNEDDPFFEKPRKDIVGPLTPVGLLDHHGHKIHVGLDRIAHRSPVPGDGLMWERIRFPTRP